MTIQGPISNASVKDALSTISDQLYSETSLPRAEEALDRAAGLLAMDWTWWTPDTAHPYTCRHASQFLATRGWPAELLSLWQSRSIALQMPFHIRSRFEHLPFVTAPDLSKRQVRGTGFARVNEFAHEMGITKMLHVPVHMEKGRVALLNWAGSVEAGVIDELLPLVSAELLLIGHLFMRIYIAAAGQNARTLEEHSQLTVREWDCMRTIAQGYREDEAAELLSISKSTVRFHIENVVRKFGCKNRTHAVALASQLGLLGPIGP